MVDVIRRSGSWTLEWGLWVRTDSNHPCRRSYECPILGRLPDLLPLEGDLWWSGPDENGNLRESIAGSSIVQSIEPTRLLDAIGTMLDELDGAQSAGGAHAFVTRLRHCSLRSDELLATLDVLS